MPSYFQPCWPGHVFGWFPYNSWIVFCHFRRQFWWSLDWSLEMSSMTNMMILKYLLPLNIANLTSWFSRDLTMMKQVQAVLELWWWKTQRGSKHRLEAHSVVIASKSFFCDPWHQQNFVEWPGVFYALSHKKGPKTMYKPTVNSSHSTLQTNLLGSIVTWII